MSTTDTHIPNVNIYKYTADLMFLLGEDVTYIDVMNIKSIAIDSDYKNMNMPMIFITLALDKRLIDKMVSNQDRALLILNIRRCVSNSDMPELYTDYINDKFVYMISEDINKNDSADYEGENEDRDDIYKLTTLGLLSLDHVNKNKKTFQGSISGKMSSIMYYLTSHLPIVIEPPTNNTVFKHRVLPPLNSVSKALKYLNSISVFYKTAYRFFIDFDFAYLISSSGKPVRRKGEGIYTVFLTLKNSYDEGSKIQGMLISEEQSMYQIQIDALDAELSDNHVSEKSYNKVSATTSSGTKSTTTIENKSADSSIVDKTMSVRIANDNSGLLDNMVSSINTSAIQLLVQKTNLDSSVLTINKEYIVKADEVYGTDKYNGYYILTRKRELYIREDTNFTLNTMILLEKIPGTVSSTGSTTTVKK